MTQFPVSTSSEQSIYAALELSKNSWLLAIQVPGRDNPSLYPIRGGSAEGLMAKLDAARDRVAKVTGQTPKVTLCYEAGYDGFWLARLLEQRGAIGPIARLGCPEPWRGHRGGGTSGPRSDLGRMSEAGGKDAMRLKDAASSSFDCFNIDLKE